MKHEWLDGYKASITGPMNAVVFDWFDVLAYPSDHAVHPNRLKEEYGGNNGDSHPNSTANSESAEVFSIFIDEAYTGWIEITSVINWSLY